MKLLLRLLLLAMMGSAYAQSNLPACQGSDAIRWNNCFGTYYFVDGRYVGDWKNGKYDGRGTTTFTNGRV